MRTWIDHSQNQQFQFIYSLSARHWDGKYRWLLNVAYFGHFSTDYSGILPLPPGVYVLWGCPPWFSGISDTVIYCLFPLYVKTWKTSSSLFKISLKNICLQSSINLHKISEKNAAGLLLPFPAFMQAIRQIRGEMKKHVQKVETLFPADSVCIPALNAEAEKEKS